MKAGRKSSLAELAKGPGIRFALVGGCLTILDLLLFQLFANTWKVSLFGAPANITAVWLGTPIVITLNFFISHRFVWKSSTSKRKTFAPFFGLNIFSGIFLQSIVVALFMMILSMFVDNSGVNPWLNLLAKCTAVGVGMIVNFFGAKILFKWDKE